MAASAGRPSRAAWVPPLLASVGAIGALVGAQVGQARAIWIVAGGALVAVATLLSLTSVGRARRAERDRHASDASAARWHEELAERLELQEKILDAVGQGVILADRNGRPAHSNAAADRILALGASPSRATHASLLAEVVARALDSGAPVSEERELHLPERRWVALRALRFGDGALVLVDDVTEVHRMEQVRRDFVANVSHELKTPISGIALLAEQLAHAVSENPATAARFADQIRVEADRLGRLIRDLLDLSRSESDLPLSLAAVDAGEALRESVRRVATLAAAKGIDVEVDEGEPATFTADPALVASALTNLLDNAVRYSPANGWVRASIASSPEEVSFVVEDRGPGIPSAEIDRIFERFYRVDKARARATGGTGLGLAIVRHVAERHGGRVATESELGAGSRFTLTFPREESRS